MQKENSNLEYNRKLDLQNTIKISVIVPALNEDKLIGRLLESLARQSVKPDEVLIVDAGSTDKTVELGRKSGAIVYINAGQGEYPARNFGAHLSCGDIIIQTSADTIFKPDTIEKVQLEFEKDTRLGAVAGPGLPYDGPVWAKIEYRLYYRALDLWCKISRSRLASTNFVAIRRDCFLKTHGFFNEPGGDSLLFIDLSRVTKTKFKYSLSVQISGRRIIKSGFWRFHVHFVYVVFLFFPPVYGFLRKLPGFNALVNTGWTEHIKRKGI
jgi:glycosyltransferase involved in cell wall biosynthesis